MVSSPLHRGLHGLARVLVVLALLWQATQLFNGMVGIGASPGARRWAEVYLFGSRSVLVATPWFQHLLLALMAVIMLVLIAGWWRQMREGWLRWWALAATPLIAFEWLVVDRSSSLSAGWSVLSLAAGALLFLLSIAMVVCTTGYGRKPLPAREDFQRPGIFALGVFLTACLFTQVVLGAGYSHALVGIGPHLLCTLVVTSLLVCLVGLVFQRHPDLPMLRSPAVCLALLLPVDLALGAWSYIIDIRRQQYGWKLLWQQVLAGEFHLICSVLLGAVSLWLTLRAHRHLTARVISSPPSRGALEA